MSTITSPRKSRETIYEKAQRLCSEPERFEVMGQSGTDFWVGVVQGDHGRYPIFAISEEYLVKHGIDKARVGCRCRAGVRGRLCSHALAAEEMRLRGAE